MIIEIKEMYFLCGKAIRRAGLWNAEAQTDRRTFPPMGQIYRDQLKLQQETATIDAALERENRETLY